jgi:hypothetical protein
MNLQRTDSNSSQKKKSEITIIQRSQLLQQATSKFGLKRSFTTKVPNNKASPQPRVSNSTSLSRVSENSRSVY